VKLFASAMSILAIVVLGGAFWLAIGAFVSAWGSAVASIPNATADRTEHFLTPAPASANPAERIRVTPTTLPTPAPLATAPAVAPTAMPSPTDQSPTPTATPEASPTPQATPEATPSNGERAPWVLLPQPAPGARVTTGPLVLEARGRGDAPISQIRLELDGKSLPVALDQRSELIWRGAATTQVGAGHHSVKASVVDIQGRTGSYGWSFDAEN
jgi:hypothetical protein